MNDDEAAAFKLGQAAMVDKLPSNEPQHVLVQRSKKGDE